CGRRGQRRHLQPVGERPGGSGPHGRRRRPGARPQPAPERDGPEMSTIVSVLTTKDGQGSTSFALSVGWTAAEDRRVMLVDADMSGTGNLADLIALDFGSRGIGNLFGTMVISAHLLEQQAVGVRARPRLRV